MVRSSKVCLAVFALLAWLPQTASACACCSDPGDRYERDRPNLSLEEAIAQIGEKALTAASEAEAELLEPVGGDGEFAAFTKAEADSVILTLVHAKKSGTLVFRPAGSGSAIGIDLDPFDEEPSGVGISIYHESRYPLIFRGTGLLAGKSGTASLVLQGKSNACPPDRFSTWHLTLNPKDDESVQLYGKTKSVAR